MRRVELALKGMPRPVGVEPPKFHDVGGRLLEHRVRVPPDVAVCPERAVTISKRLRRERELAFDGDIDFVPTAEYSAADAARAFEDAAWIAALAANAIVRPPSG